MWIFSWVRLYSELGYSWEEARSISPDLADWFLALHSEGL